MGLNLKAATGVTLDILGCALANYNWWPIFVVAFYVLAPIPYIIAKKCGGDSYGGDSGRCLEICLFLSTILVVSAYALPIVLARSPLAKPVIPSWGSAGFIFAGNTVIFATIGTFIYLMNAEEGYSYSGW